MDKVLLRLRSIRLPAAAFMLLALALAVVPIESPSQSKLRQRRKFTRLLKDPRLFISTLKSSLLARDVRFRLIVPPGYDAENKARFPTLYLLHGLSGHADNWSQKTQLLRYAADYRFIIVMPEGGDGWYTDSATIESDKYESYLIRNMIPAIDRKFRTLADRDHRFIAGLSMGGYGAIKFGLKYPELFSLVGSFSGALDAPMRSEKTGNKWPSIPAVFGTEGSKTRMENDIFTQVRNLPTEKIASLPFIYFDCGTEDPFLAVNREFAGLLVEKKIPHEFRELPGKHGWPYWNQQVQELLRVARRRLIAESTAN